MASAIFFTDLKGLWAWIFGCFFLFSYQKIHYQINEHQAKPWSTEISGMMPRNLVLTFSSRQWSETLMTKPQELEKKSQKRLWQVQDSLHSLKKMASVLHTSNIKTSIVCLSIEIFFLRIHTKSKPFFANSLLIHKWSWLQETTQMPWCSCHTCTQLSQFFNIISMNWKKNQSKTISLLFMNCLTKWWTSGSFFFNFFSKNFFLFWF